MVGTLIRHEAIRTRGLLATIFGAAAILTLVGAALSATMWPLISQLGMFMAILGAVGTVPAAQLGLAWDYWQSGYRRIGYFTQTLPVRGSTIYWVRLAWGLVVLVAGLLWSAVLGVLAFFGTAGALGMHPFDIFTLVGDWFIAIAAVLPWWGWLAAPVLLVVFVGFNLVQYYFAASVGSERRFTSLGVGGPVLVWFAVYLAMQLVFLAFMLLIPLGVTVVDGSLALTSQNFLGAIIANEQPGSMPAGIIPAFVVAGVVLVWRTVISWDRRVSLA